MSSLRFLAHNQLHEVIFGFMQIKDVLTYRQIHSKCDEIVACHAETQIQDAVGQDLSIAAILGDSEARPIRFLDARLLKVLVLRGHDIVNVLSKSPGGVRSVSAKLIQGTSQQMITNALGALIRAATTVESARSLRHVDVSEVGDSHVSTAFVEMVVAYSTELRYLDSSGFRSKTFRSDSVLARLATNCRLLQHLNIGGRDGEVTDEGMSLIAVNCRDLRYLNIRDTSDISDKSMKVVATNCLKLQVVMSVIPSVFRMNP